MLSPVLAPFRQLDPLVAAEWQVHVADDFAELGATPSSGVVAYCHAFRDDRALFTAGHRRHGESVPRRLAPLPGVSYETALGLPASTFDLRRSDRFEAQMAQREARLARPLAAIAVKETV